MSSCQGELANRAFNVRAVGEEGRIFVNETIHTLPNGFFELWLPRNRKIALTVEGLNRSVKGIIGTFEGSNTCITTLQLK